MVALVKGITLNTNLYTNKEDARSEDEEEMLPKQAESESEDLSMSHDGDLDE